MAGESRHAAWQKERSFAVKLLPEQGPPADLARGIPEFLDAIDFAFEWLNREDPSRRGTPSLAIFETRGGEVEAVWSYPPAPPEGPALVELFGFNPVTWKSGVPEYSAVEARRPSPAFASTASADRRPAAVRAERRGRRRSGGRRRVRPRDRRRRRRPRRRAGRAGGPAGPCTRSVVLHEVVTVADEPTRSSSARRRQQSPPPASGSVRRHASPGPTASAAGASSSPPPRSGSRSASPIRPSSRSCSSRSRRSGGACNAAARHWPSPTATTGSSAASSAG